MNAPATIQRDLRAEFPGLVTAEGKPWHYLDTAATAQKPRAVIDAMSRALGEDYATVHRGVYTRSAEMTLAYEAARRRIAAWFASATGHSSQNRPKGAKQRTPPTPARDARRKKRSALARDLPTWEP